MIIYMVINKINGKSYIGQTVSSNLENRKKQHIGDALSNSDTYFHKALRKYDYKNFDWEVLHKCNDIDNLNKLEIYYIKLYNTFKNGYNLTIGGNGSIGLKHNRNSKKKISIAKIGKKFSEEHKRKIGKAMKNKKLSIKHKQKIGKAMKGSNNPIYGKTHSKETRQKQSKVMKGRFTGKNNSHTCPVIVKGKFFYTITEAAKFLNIPYNTLWNRLQKSKHLI